MQGYTLTYTTYLEPNANKDREGGKRRNKDTPLNIKYVHYSCRHKAVVKYHLLR